MMNWLSANGATLVVGLVVAAVITAVILKMIRDKKNHKGSCGCSYGTRLPGRGLLPQKAKRSHGRKSVPALHNRCVPKRKQGTAKTVPFASRCFALCLWCERLLQHVKSGQAGDVFRNAIEVFQIVLVEPTLRIQFVPERDACPPRGNSR